MTNLLTEISRIREIMGLSENIQVADKVFFKPGVLNSDVRNAILDITGGDNFTKLVTDLYFHFSKQNDQDESGVDGSLLRMCEDFYDDLVTYDKKLFPLKNNLTDFGSDKDNDLHVLTLLELLKAWHQLSFQWSKLPSFLRRNLGQQIKALLSDPAKPNHTLSHYYSDVAKTLREINETIKSIPQDKLDEILPTLASSKKSLDDVQKSLKNIQNTLSYVNQTMIDVNPIVDKIEHVNADLIVNNNGVLVIKINDHEAMQELGCFTNWCFAHPGSEEHWENYAPYGYVYLIYNTNIPVEDARFLMVYLPSSGELFLANNVLFNEVYRGQNSHTYMKTLGIDTTKLN